MSDPLNDPARCLLIPAADLVTCGAELAGYAAALAPAQLDAEARKAIDTGSGLPAECRRAETAAHWLGQCPTAAKAAGATAGALPAAAPIAAATEEVITIAAAFQRAARGGALLFLASLSVVPQLVRDALARRLAAPGLPDEDRDGLQADLTALAAPVDSDAERARDAELRFERRKADLVAEVEVAEQGAGADRARFEVLDAVRRGEALPPEALLSLQPTPASATPAPRRRTRR